VCPGVEAPAADQHQAHTSKPTLIISLEELATTINRRVNGTRRPTVSVSQAERQSRCSHTVLPDTPQATEAQHATTMYSHGRQTNLKRRTTKLSTKFISVLNTSNILLLYDIEIDKICFARSKKSNYCAMHAVQSAVLPLKANRPSVLLSVRSSVCNASTLPSTHNP